MCPKMGSDAIDATHSTLISCAAFRRHILFNLRFLGKNFYGIISHFRTHNLTVLCTTYVKFYKIRFNNALGLIKCLQCFKLGFLIELHASDKRILLKDILK